MDRDDIKWAGFCYEVVAWLTWVVSFGVAGATAIVVVYEFTDHWYTGIPLFVITCTIVGCLIYFPAILPIQAMRAVFHIAKNTPIVNSN